jgi:hypothetical protein
MGAKGAAERLEKMSMGGAHWWVGPTHRRRRRGFEEGVRWAAGTRASSGPWRGGGGVKRGRAVGLGCGVGFSLFFPISLFPLLSILNLALAFQFKINMLCEFKWRHNNSKHHTKLGAPACDATTIIPLGF